MPKRMSAMLLLGCLLWIGLPAVAQPVKDTAAHDKQHTEWLSQLNLTPAQKTKLQSVLAARREHNRQARETLRVKRQQLHTLLQDPNSAKEQALTLQKDIAAAQDQLMQKNIDGIYEIRAVLTPEQFQKFQAQMAQMKARHGGRRRPEHS